MNLNGDSTLDKGHKNWILLMTLLDRYGNEKD
jgi:hypothetical protein